MSRSVADFLSGVDEAKPGPGPGMGKNAMEKPWKNMEKMDMLTMINYQLVVFLQQNV
jgi:hypothetical protein